jgi:hypothetical protein
MLTNTALGQASMYFRQAKFAGCNACLAKCVADNAGDDK